MIVRNTSLPNPQRLLRLRTNTWLPFVSGFRLRLNGMSLTLEREKPATSQNHQGRFSTFIWYCDFPCRRRICLLPEIARFATYVRYGARSGHCDPSRCSNHPPASGAPQSAPPPATGIDRDALALAFLLGRGNSLRSGRKLLALLGEKRGPDVNLVHLVEIGLVAGEKAGEIDRIGREGRPRPVEYAVLEATPTAPIDCLAKEKITSPGCTTVIFDQWVNTTPRDPLFGAHR